MDRTVEVVKLDERSKYRTFWPLERVELGARVSWYLEQENQDDGNNPLDEVLYSL